MHLIPEDRRGRAEDRRPGDHLLSFREGPGRWLDASSAQDVQALLDACRDDLRLAVGGEPEEGEARALLLELPEGISPERRLLLGVYGAAGTLIAALDAYRDFPEPRAWFLAMVLVHPAARGRGLATGLVARLERFARAEGVAEFHCIAPGRNPATRQFLLRSGFVPAKDVDLDVDSRTLRGLHLVRALAPVAAA